MAAAKKKKPANAGAVTGTEKQEVPARPRIFVQVAAYRDPDCQHTIRDMFEKAKYPDRITVGICWQFVKGEDDVCFQVPYPYPQQVRVKEVDARKSQGVCWARNLAQQLWDGEEFTFQIDSHMRFERGWDEMLLDMWKQCGSPKAVLTCYPPGFTPPDNLDRTWIFGMGAKEFDADGIFTMQGKPAYEVSKPLPKKPMLGAFASANMLFGPASLIRDVPYDPYLYFFGEEISLAVRLWTHGYDLYHPNRLVIYHDWDRGKRPTHFTDHRDWGTLNQRAYKRVRHMLRSELTKDKDALKDLDKYGLGSARSLEEYQDFSGVDFAKQTIRDFARNGTFAYYHPVPFIEAPRQQVQWNTAPSHAKDQRIFVAIPCYRDRELQKTIRDLYAKAKHPHSIFVGICWQFDPEEDKQCFMMPYPHPDQVRVVNYHYRDAKGANWARVEALKLRHDEPYTLLIDAHMRFEQDWDQSLLDMLSQCASEKAVLGSYPPDYHMPDELDRGHITRMGYMRFEPDDGSRAPLVAYSAQKIRNEEAPIRPFLTASVSHGFMFTRSEAFIEVPFDPYIYFFNDEMSLAVRLWTHGWDMYCPNRTVIYHLWESLHRRKVWEDDSEHGPFQHSVTRERIGHLIGMIESDDPEAIKDLDRYGLGTVRTLAEYQAFAGVNFAQRTVQKFSENGCFLPYVRPHKEQSVNPLPLTPVHKHNARIFVNIASYRDSECQWTVKDLFEKAANPDRIVVGICWQYDEQEDMHCFEVSTRPNQVRVHPVDWREAEGVCWARHQAQQLWEDEEYTLMIDSHMRFMPGWDEMMIEELHACDGDNPVLSCSPPSYTPPNNLGRSDYATVRRVKPFTPDGNIRCHGEALDRRPEKPLPGAFLVANFVFSRSNIVREVPYDPYLYFDQEEITYALRLYTHGWNIFHPTRQFLYHYYNDRKPGSVGDRPLHWVDLHKEDAERIKFLRDRGLKRFNHLTGYHFSNDADILRDLSQYGLGKVRTLQEFERFSGIDFKRKIASERALLCQFIPNLSHYRTRPFNIPELASMSYKPPVASLAKEDIAIRPAAPIRPAPLRMLEAGDFIPLFELPDTADRTAAIERLGGKYIMLTFLPAGDELYLKEFFVQLDKELPKSVREQSWRLFVLDAPVEKLKALKISLGMQYDLCADADRNLARALGIMQPNESVLHPVGFLLSGNHKILRRYAGMNAVTLASSMVQDCGKAVADFEQRSRNPLLIMSTAPLLVVPDALSPELCQKCIEAFRNGHTFDGTVGAGEQKAYRADNKLRTDHIVGRQLLEELDDKLSRSLFPEIKKVFGFDVTFREAYKVGMYSGEKGGFFKAHRDNFQDMLGYRRLAMTLHLNDDYEGGGLRFPEYDNHVYRPPAGSANVFSCATLHEARQVTKGERFVLVGFFHGDEEEAYRRHYLMGKGQPLHGINYTPVLRDYSSVPQSRDFYRKWQREQVSYNGAAASSTAASPLPPKGVMVNTLGKHQAKKVFESKEGVIFDDFLPEDIYKEIYDYSLRADYEYINSGAVNRAWHIEDGHPLRGVNNVFYYAQGVDKPNAHYVYPTHTPLDKFAEHIVAAQAQVEHIVGKQARDWGHFSITNWIYPSGTGLALHDDGSGVYTGAYAYFLNPNWRLHWGGLLLMVEEEGNRLVQEYRRSHDQMEFYQKGLLHASPLDDLLMEYGFAKCIFPKRNRMVFIANDAYHMVTRVNEQAGDNVRMSLAGFFDRKKQ